MRMLVEMCISGNFAQNLQEVRQPSGLLMTVAEDAEAERLERESILKHETLLASLCNEQPPTAATSRLLGKVVNFSPRSFVRRLPQEFLREIQLECEQVSLRFALCASRSPDFLLEMVTKSENASSWLAPLIQQHSELVDLLPPMVVCQMIALASEAIHMSSTTHLIARLNSSLDKSPEIAPAVYDYFLCRVGRPSANERLTAKAVLERLLSERSSSGAPADRDGIPRWIEEGLPSIGRFSPGLWRAVLSNLREAVQFETEMSALQGYFRLISNHPVASQHDSELSSCIGAFFLARPVVGTMLLDRDPRLVANFVGQIGKLMSGLPASAQSYVYSAGDRLIEVPKTGFKMTPSPIPVSVLVTLIHLLTAHSDPESNLIKEIEPFKAPMASIFKPDENRKVLLAIPEIAALVRHVLTRSAPEALFDMMVSHASEADALHSLSCLGIPLRNADTILGRLDAFVLQDTSKLLDSALQSAFGSDLMPKINRILANIRFWHGLGLRNGRGLRQAIEAISNTHAEPRRLVDIDSFFKSSLLDQDDGSLRAMDTEDDLSASLLPPRKVRAAPLDLKTAPAALQAFTDTLVASGASFEVDEAQRSGHLYFSTVSHVCEGRSDDRLALECEEMLQRLEAKTQYTQLELRNEVKLLNLIFKQLQARRAPLVGAAAVRLLSRIAAPAVAGVSEEDMISFSGLEFSALVELAFACLGADGINAWISSTFGGEAGFSQALIAAHSAYTEYSLLFNLLVESVRERLAAEMSLSVLERRALSQEAHFSASGVVALLETYLPWSYFTQPLADATQTQEVWESIILGAFRASERGEDGSAVLLQTGLRLDNNEPDPALGVVKLPDSGALLLEWLCTLRSGCSLDTLNLGFLGEVPDRSSSSSPGAAGGKRASILSNDLLQRHSWHERQALVLKALSPKSSTDGSPSPACWGEALDFLSASLREPSIWLSCGRRNELCESLASLDTTSLCTVICCVIEELRSCGKDRERANGLLLKRLPMLVHLLERTQNVQLAIIFDSVQTWSVKASGMSEPAARLVSELCFVMPRASRFAGWREGSLSNSVTLASQADANLHRLLMILLEPPVPPQDSGASAGDGSAHASGQPLSAASNATAPSANGQVGSTSSGLQGSAGNAFGGSAVNGVGGGHGPPAVDGVASMEGVVGPNGNGSGSAPGSNGLAPTSSQQTASAPPLSTSPVPQGSGKMSTSAGEDSETSEKMRVAYFTLRHIARHHPGSLLRYVPIIGAMLSGRAQLDSDEFFRRKYDLVFGYSLGLLETLRPVVFETLSAHDLSRIISPFLELMDISCIRNERVIPLMQRLVSFLGSLAREAMGVFETIVSAYSNVLLTFAEAYPEIDVSFCLGSIVAGSAAARDEGEREDARAVNAGRLAYLIRQSFRRDSDVLGQLYDLLVLALESSKSDASFLSYV